MNPPPSGPGVKGPRRDPSLGTRLGGNSSGSGNGRGKAVGGSTHMAGAVPETGSDAVPGSRKFRTDTDISFDHHKGAGDRVLQRWVDDAPQSSKLDDALDMSKQDKAPWDQFSANREKFGVETTYDEHYYTTAINRAKPRFADRERRAKQLAREIEGSGHGGNVHVAEERGVDLTSGLDEEDLYSGVARTSSASGDQTGDINSARRVAKNQGYLEERERLDRASDLKKFSSTFPGESSAAPDSSSTGSRQSSVATSTVDAKPVAKGARASGERKPEPSGKYASGDKSATPKSDEAASKKRFNFNAAAAKAAAFKPAPRFVPMGPPPVQISSPPPPTMLPGGVVPMRIPMPPMFVPPSMSPSSSVTSGKISPTGSPPGQASPRTQTPQQGPLRPLGDDFDLYVRHMRDQIEMPRPFATAPTWPTASDASYRELLTGPVPQMMPMMPYGFVVPPTF